jgi:uncharacterized protein YhaN
MRIDRIRVGAFGRFMDLDTGAQPLEGLVVVLGPNEAGKSTLFSFLTTALYGFQPASRERNPHVPWGSDEAAGHIRVRAARDRTRRAQELHQTCGLAAQRLLQRSSQSIAAKSLARSRHGRAP